MNAILDHRGKRESDRSFFDRFIRGQIILPWSMRKDAHRGDRLARSGRTIRISLRGRP